MKWVPLGSTRIGTVLRAFFFEFFLRSSFLQAAGVLIRFRQLSFRYFSLTHMWTDVSEQAELY
jgi:hypothetical protein